MILNSGKYSILNEDFKQLFTIDITGCNGIVNAYELQNDDFLSYCGILPTDNPVIPSGKENAPVLEMIERKKQFIH